MYRVAAIKNNVIVNVLRADTMDAVDSLPVLLPEIDVFVIETDETNKAMVNGLVRAGKFYPAAPYASWQFNEQSLVWEAPEPEPTIPEGKYLLWDEDSTSWNILDIPVFVEED